MKLNRAAILDLGLRGDPGYAGELYGGDGTGRQFDCGRLGCRINGDSMRLLLIGVLVHIAHISRVYILLMIRFGSQEELSARVGIDAPVV